jgi:probable F420-dependent oxidoreductase
LDIVWNVILLGWKWDSVVPNRRGLRMPRPFRFAVINETMLPASDWIAHVRRIEELGYASFLIRDHFAPDFFGPQLAPFSALSAAAIATTRLRVGTMVLDNDYRHPVILAKEAATLDMLSGGRLELGIGAGWLRSEYQQAGIPYERAGTRIDRMDESLTILKGLFSGEPVHYQGEHYTIDGLAGYPLPAQRPHPPILIGGGKRRVLTLAGREADIVGILTSSVASGTVEDGVDERLPEAVEQKIGWIREGAGARFADIELSLIPSVHFTDNRRERAAQLISERGWPNVTVDDVLSMPSFLIGTRDEIIEDILLRRDRYGFSYYVISDSMLEAFAPVVAELA